MANASTIRLILALSLAVLLFAALPYQGFDIPSHAWADDDDGDKGEDEDDDDDDEDEGGKKGGGGGGKESRGGKGSKSDAEPTDGNDAGTGGEVASDTGAPRDTDAASDTDAPTDADASSDTGVATASAESDASADSPGEATAEQTALAAPDESNDDDERRRGANFFAGMDAYKKAEYDLALGHWLPLAEHGHAAAQTGLGAVYYRTGQHADAFRWSRMAARQGEADAAHNLAVLYQFGLGTPFSMSQAMLWYGEAASRGSRKATLALRELRGGPLVGLVVPVPISKPDPAENVALHRLTEEAQILLATLGYDPGPIDGRAGARTRAAVERFEQDRELFIRGRVNETLLANLRRAIVEASATVISTR